MPHQFREDSRLERSGGTGTSLVRTAQPRPLAPEAQVGALRSDLLRTGGARRTEGLDAIRSFNPDQFLGADALSGIIEQATVTSFLPQLRKLQARNSRRNIRGPLAGAVEGDLASAFQRNITAEAGRLGGERARLTFARGREIAEIGGTDRAQGVSLLGTELEIELAREQAKREEDARKRRGKGALIGTILGGVGGALLGNPLLGAQIGATVGGTF